MNNLGKLYAIIFCTAIFMFGLLASGLFLNGGVEPDSAPVDECVDLPIAKSSELDIRIYNVAGEMLSMNRDEPKEIYFYDHWSFDFYVGLMVKPSYVRWFRLSIFDYRC